MISDLKKLNLEIINNENQNNYFQRRQQIESVLSSLKVQSPVVVPSISLPIINRAKPDLLQNLLSKYKHGFNLAFSFFNLTE